MRSKGGRHIISYLEGKESKRNLLKIKESSRSGFKDRRNNNKDMEGENKILRPNLSFLSNARPSMLKWRELEIEKTPIINLSKNRKYKSVRYKKYSDSDKVPGHLEYARNIVEAKNSPITNLNFLRFTKNVSSPTSWLPAPSFVNGLPNTIYHFKYPLRTRNLAQ